MELLIDIDKLLEYIDKATFCSTIKPTKIDISNGKLNCIVFENEVGVSLKIPNEILYIDEKTLFKKDILIPISNHLLFKKYLYFLKNNIPDNQRFIKCKIDSLDELESIYIYDENINMGFTYPLSDGTDNCFIDSSNELNLKTLEINKSTL